MSLAFWLTTSAGSSSMLRPGVPACPPFASLMTENLLQEASVQTPLGEVRAIVEDGRLRRLDYGSTAGEREPAWLVDAVNAYFDGELDALMDLPLDLAGSEFHQRVWKALRETKAGEVLSYKE